MADFFVAGVCTTCYGYGAYVAGFEVREKDGGTCCRWGNGAGFRGDVACVKEFGAYGGDGQGGAGEKVVRAACGDAEELGAWSLAM